MFKYSVIYKFLSIEWKKKSNNFIFPIVKYKKEEKSNKASLVLFIKQKGSEIGFFNQIAFLHLSWFILKS